MRKGIILLCAGILLAWGSSVWAEVEPTAEAVEAFNAYVEAYKGGDAQTAEAKLKAVIEMQSDWATPHLHLGELYIDQQKFPAAVTALEEASSLNADDALTLHYLGFAYLQLEQYPEAITALEKSQSLDPGLKEGQEFLTKAYLELGNTKKNEKKAGEAVRAYKSAIKLDPNVFAAHYNLGNLYLETEDYADAEEAFRNAVRLEPKNFKAHFNLAIALHYQGALEEALAEYEKVVEVGGSQKAAKSVVAQAKQVIPGLKEQIQTGG